ncbi:MAG TPA: hypothetical protein VGO70_06270 [Arsenicitalea sp.]|nr:hypothetical protein [Arsenicitalea sp.]
MSQAVPSTPRLLILSSHSNPVLSAPINHQTYATRHGYNYLFDATPYISRSKYDQKYLSILAAMGNYDWVFWVDNDVYFMNHEIGLERFIPADEDTDFVFCNSPLNSGQFTVLNSGAFFVRNSEGARDFLRAALATDLSDVKNWWDTEKNGLFTNGDQDQITYVALERGMIGKTIKLVDFTSFNARHFNYTDRHDQHFAIHLCGAPPKGEQIALLRAKFNLDPYLLPAGTRYDAALQRSMFFVRPPDKRSWPAKLLPELIKRPLRRLRRRARMSIRVLG